MGNLTLNLILLLILLLIAFVIYKKIRKSSDRTKEIFDDIRDEKELIKKDKVGPISGAVVGFLAGTILEEIVESVFDLPNLGPLGEILGGLSGYKWGRRNLRRFQNAQRALLKFAAREAGEKRDIDEIEKEKLEDLFKDMPKERKIDIMMKFKDIAPYEYGLIREMLEKEV